MCDPQPRPQGVEEIPGLRENVAALKGQQMQNQSLDNKNTRLCLIHGIRSHDGFLEDLRGRLNLDPVYIRSLNARAIMSNRIPEMNAEEDFPYCFWDPDIPNESTLRSLISLYPRLKYHVGRVCAMAGNTTLYQELDLLPDVAIAEEARDSKAFGAKAIFNAIMQQPVKYAVMDDYHRRIRSSPIAGACLNGDTCVRSTLRKKQRSEDFENSAIIRCLAFDITEDRHIALDGTYPENWSVDPAAVALLYNPLPRDLPTVDKDLLILMAAWSGDIDRYVRLRRPVPIAGEDACVIRGIYHSTPFAKWCSLQPDMSRFMASVHARFIADNNLGWASGAVPADQLPTIIWHPQPAYKGTYRELARRQPSMKQNIAEACIVADYRDVYDELDPTPTPKLIHAAQKRAEDGIKHYLDHLAPKLGPMGIEEYTYWEGDDAELWPSDKTVLYKGLNGWGQCRTLYKDITTGHMGYNHYLDPWGIAWGSGESPAAGVLLHISAAGLIEVPEPYESLDLQEVYDDGPYVSAEDRKMLGLSPNPRRPRGGYRGRGGGPGRGGRGRGG